MPHIYNEILDVLEKVVLKHVTEKYKIINLLLVER
jgi:hypothetical protein